MSNFLFFSSRRKKNFTRCGYAVFLLSCLCCAALAAEEADEGAKSTESDLAQARKQLTQLRSQREQNKAQMAQDERDFAVYSDRTAKRRQQLRSDIDSLNQQSIVAQRRSDSLGSRIRAVQSQKEEIDLQTENLRKSLMSSCDRLDTQACALAPLTQAPVRSSLALIKSDLSAKTIEVAEAFTRLAQVVTMMREACSSIQTASEVSPIAEIRGTASMLRIGSVFAACVDATGSKCYLWQGNAVDGVPSWANAPSPETGPAMIKAIAIRDGKALPALVDLPFSSSRMGGAQ